MHLASYFRYRNFNTIEPPMSLFTASLGLGHIQPGTAAVQQLCAPAGYFQRNCTIKPVRRDGYRESSHGHADALALMSPAVVPVAEPVKRGRGRPRIHVDAAAKTAAHRAKKVRLDVTLPPAMGATVARLAESLDCSQNELLQSFVRFALNNRNWQQMGLFGSKALA